VTQDPLTALKFPVPVNDPGVVAKYFDALDTLNDYVGDGWSVANL
jgi:hypothetical protein